MRGKRNVSVCRGHELANALYVSSASSKYLTLQGLVGMVMNCAPLFTVLRNQPGFKIFTK